MSALSRPSKPARGALIGLALQSKSGMMHVARVTSVHNNVHHPKEPGGSGDKANGFRHGRDGS